MDTLDYHRECRHVYDHPGGDIDWAPAIVFAKDMGEKIAPRKGGSQWEEKEEEEREERCIYRELRYVICVQVQQLVQTTHSPTHPTTDWASNW